MQEPQPLGEEGTSEYRQRQVNIGEGKPRKTRYGAKKKLTRATFNIGEFLFEEMDYLKSSTTCQSFMPPG